MSSQLKIYCKNLERYIDFSGGETLAEIYDRVKAEIPFRPICAHVNNKTEDLQFPLFCPKVVEFLPVTSASGHRVYVRSLCMMLYKAVTECYPGARLQICHSISRGYYGRLDRVEVTAEVVETLAAKMRELAARDIPFERKERLTADVKEMFRKQGLDDKVALLDTLHDLYTVYYRLDGVIDSYYGNLAPSTSYLRCFDLKPYHDGFLLLACGHEDLTEPEQPITQEKMYRAFTDYVHFNNVIGVSNVGELNKSTEDRRSADLINVAEALHDKKISEIADEITERYRQGGARVVLIAGPSSSGKTTFTKRLAIY